MQAETSPSWTFDFLASKRFSSGRRHVGLFLLILLLGCLATAASAAPRWIELTPADGELLDTGTLTLEGRVEGAARVVIDGDEWPLAADGSFRAGPFAVKEGERRFLIVLEDIDGEESALVHRVLVDRRAPVLSVDRNAALVNSPSLLITGTALDPHLESVTVAGRPATLVNGRFESRVTLDRGVQNLEIVARDRLGHESRESLSVEFDDQRPWVEIYANGRRLQKEPTIFRGDVLPEIRAEGAAKVTLKLNGRSVEAGQPVTEEGEYLLIVEAYDAAGNGGGTLGTFTIDRTAPQFGRVKEAGKVRKERSFTLEGQVEGAVSVTVDGQPAILDAGTYRAGPFDLDGGERVFRVVARDAAGNERKLNVPVKSDPDAPDLTLTSPAEGAVVAASPITLSGTAVDADLASVTANVDGGAEFPATLDGDSFTVSLALAEGSNLITATATDAVSNSSQATRTVVLDTTPPTIQLMAGGVPLDNGAVFAGLVTPELTTTDATAVTVEATLDGLPWSPGTSITDLGGHDLQITATDAAGHSSSLLRTFTLEGAAPQLSGLTPTDGTILSASEIRLSGRATGAVSLTVDGQNVTLVGGDFTTAPITLAEGPRSFAIVATSAGGQTTNLTLNLTRDATVPTVAITAPADGDIGSESVITVTGTVSDAHFDALTVNGATATVTGDPASGATFEATVTLAEGSNRLRARAVDQAGLVATAEREAVLDTRAPEVEIVDPAPGTVIGAAQATVSGRVADPNLDRVEIAGVTATLSGSQTWSADVSLAEGTNTLTATAFDTLGHQSSATLEIVREDSAPLVTITSPAQGTATQAATIDVSGTVAAGATVTVNGADATVSSGTFSVTGVELSEGENRIIARADLGSEQGSHVRTVVRDNEAPVVHSVSPADGSEGLPRDTIFTITFSEPLAEPAAGAFRLETGAGTPIAATGSFDDGELEGVVFSVAPQGLLPPASEVRLVATAQLEDRAGNALGAATWTFTTVSDGAPAAPTLDPVPSSLCANGVTLSGTAAVGARVRVAGGGSSAETRAGADGAWTVDVTLEPGRLHLLEVSSIDAEGRVSASAWAEVAQDCSPPHIVEAQRSADVFTVSFDEEIAAATLAVTVSDASGALAGDLQVTGDTATWTATAALPSGVLRLEIGPLLTDVAGNALGFPWVRLFGAGDATSFLSGTALDESTGRPLEGATVVVTRSGGVATTDPRPEMTTGADGRFLIAVAPGTHDLTISRPEYSPVFRVVTTTTGEGTEVFTPRLEPVGVAETIGASGGILEAASSTGGTARLEIDAGVFAADSSVQLTALSEQALPALLPYGWSPRGAVWLDLGLETPVLPSTLEIPVAAPAGTILTIAELDLDSLQWRAVEEQAVAGGQVSLSLDPASFVGAGAFAALEADSGATAPPLPVVGEVLGSSAQPTSTEVLGATLSFDPEVVLPTQTADAVVLYTLASSQPSGLPLTLLIQEELELVDGTLRREAPYRAQLVLYHDGAGQPSSRFRLQPSHVARSQPVRLGAEDVTVLRYTDEGVRGNVLGPDGGWVLGDAGDRLEVPAGALNEPTPVVLERRDVGDLPLAAPNGGTVAAVLEIDLGDQELAAAGLLSFAIDPAPAAGTRALLLHVADLTFGPAPGPAYRAVAELEPTATGLQTKAIDPADLPWPGVRSGGFYVALVLDFDPAFVTGEAIGEDGLVIDGALVSSPQVDWIQLSNADGTYVLPVPVGEVTIDLLDPRNGNVATTTVTVSAADERVDADIQATPTGPRVLSTTPADGDEVPAGIQPQVSFSEAIDPASVVGGIELLRDGEAVPVAFDVQGALVTVLPTVSLASGAPYELRVLGGFGEGLRDLQGYSLEAPVTVTFTVSEVVLPNTIDPSKITLFAPVGGQSQIVGTAGAVPANNLVWVENLTSYETTESATSAADGSFTLTIGAEIGDEILFHVLIEGANEYIKLLGPYMSTDRKGAFVGREALNFTTGDGVTVMADADTFDDYTEVRVVPKALTDAPEAPWPAPGVFEPVYRFELDFGDAAAKRPLNIRVPAPADAQPEWYVLAKSWEFFGQPMWSMKDIMVLDGGELTTERDAAPPSSSLNAGQPADKSLGRAAGEKSDPPPDPSDPRDYKVAVVTAGNFSVFRSGQPLMWAVLSVDPMAIVFSGAVPGMVIEAADALDYLSGKQDWAVPTLLGQDFEIYAKDARTGFELFREVFQALDQPLQVLPPALLGDKGKPFLLGSEPLILQTVAANPGSRDLRFGVSVEITEERDGDDVLLEDQTMTITFAKESLVIDHRPEDDSPITLEAKLVSMEDGSEIAIEIGEAIETDDVTLSRQVKVGESYLLMVGALLRLDEWIVMEWNESLDQELEGIELEILNPNPTSVPVTAEPVGTYETIRIRPREGWKAGEKYQLRLRGTVKDVAGNEILPSDSPGSEESAVIRLEIRSQRVFQGFDFTTVRDVERLGSLLFVAAGHQGLWVLDATDPENLVNYFGGEGSDLHFGFPLAGQVRGVAIDPHGRVIVSGGGVSAPGQIKILDPLEFPENPTDNNDLAEAWRGSTLVSNKLGGTQFAQMPPATPSHLEILSRDREASWVVGIDEIPEGITMAPQEVPFFEEVEVTISGSDGVEGQPVTLRNLTRGTWDRIDAEAGGAYSLSIDVRHGERLQILRNTDTLAYVKLDFKGLAAVDINHFYGESDDADGDGVADDPEIVQSQVLRYYTHSILENTPGDVLCDPNGLYLGDDPAFLPTDFTLMGRATNGPFFLPTIMHSYGLVMIVIDGNNPVQVAKVGNVCGVAKKPNPSPSDIGFMTGMGVAESYHAQVIFNDDEVFPAVEGLQEVEIDGEQVKVGRLLRDYIFMGNTHGHVYVVDVSNKVDLRIVAKIELPEPPAGPMTFDRESGRLLVSSSSNGVYVVDLNGPFPLAAIDLEEETIRDANDDGEDDRVLEQVEVRDSETGETLNVNRRVQLWQDLGLAWIGGVQNVTNPGDLGLGGLVYRAPRVRFLGDSKKGLLEVDQLAPFGVPTAEVFSAREEGTELPGLFRVEMHLPGELADQAGELKVDLVSVGPGGLEITPAGDPEEIEKLPPTSYRGDDGLVLKRQSDKPWHEGYQIFLSEPIISLADLRASHWYEMTEKEKDAEDGAGEKLCRRCDLHDPDQGVYPEGEIQPDKAFRELLSGHRIAIRLQDETEASLVDLYGPLLASQAEAEIDSVAWDISPSLEQEPFQSPSNGHGEVAPGTLLHSGEFTHDVVDLELSSVGFDFLFNRSYRNQTVGGGPLGPGWDFGYRARLRPLPNRDVDYFDGRGRRVVFQWDEDELILRPPPGVFMTLLRDTSGFRIKDRNGSILQFDRWGRLRSILDTFKTDEDAGSELFFEYDPSSKLTSVAANGRSLSFEYDDDHRLERVVDDTDRDVLFEYDTDGRLITVKSPLTKLSKDGTEERLVTNYTYENAGFDFRELLNRRDNLESIEDARGDKWLQLQWADGDGAMGHQLETQTWGEDSLTLAFTEGSPTMTVTDRRGKTHTYQHNESGQVTSYKDPEDHEKTWEYGAYGTDPEQGLVTEIKWPSGRKMIYEYALQEAFASGSPVPQIFMPNLSKMAQLPGEGDEVVVAGACAPADASTNGSGEEIAWTYSGHHSWTHTPEVTTSPSGGQSTTTFAGPEREGWPVSVALSLSTGLGAGSAVQSSFIQIGSRDDLGRIEEQTVQRSDGESVTSSLTYDEDSSTPAKLPESGSVTVDGQTYDVEMEKDAQGRVTKVTEPGGVERTWTFNSVGWLLEECYKKAPVDSCTRYTYEPDGQVKKLEQPIGETGSEHIATHYTYGLLGEVERVETEVTPGGARVTEVRTYDENLNLTSLDETGMSPRTLEYNDRNLVEKSISVDDEGNNLTERYTYNGDGQIATIVDARQKTWTFLVDGYGRDLQTVDPLMNGNLVSYDDAGNPRNHISCNDQGEALVQKETVYDDAGRLISEVEIDPEGEAPPAETAYTFDSASNLIRVTNPLNETIEYEYDGLQRLVEMSVQGGSVFSMRWEDHDERGNARREVMTVPAVGASPTTYTRTFEYDAFDRPKVTIDGRSNRFEQKFDVRGNQISATEPGGFTTTYSYDGLDRLTQVSRPLGITASFQYLLSANSSQTIYKDAKDQPTIYDYDGLDRLEKVTYADGKTETYTYDANANATDFTLADGTRVQQTFDDVSRITHRVVTPGSGLGGHGVENFSYDALDRLTSADLQGVVSTFAYDGLSRLKSETTSNKTVGYGFDTAGQVTGITFPSNHQVTQWWDASGQLRKVHADPTSGPSFFAQYGWQGPLAGSKWVGLATDPESPDQEILSGSWKRDAAERVESSFFTSPGGGPPLLHEKLVRDGRGKITHHNFMERGGQGWHRTYDNAGRLTSQSAHVPQPGDPEEGGHVATSVGSSFAFTFDNVDNLLEKEAELTCSMDTEALPLDASSRNRPASADGTALEYDANGYLTKKGDLQFTYDYRGRLIEVKREVGASLETVATYGYDALDRRITRTVGGQTWRTVWNGWQAVEEYLDVGGSDTLMSRRIYGSGLDEIIGLQVRQTPGAQLTDYVPLYDQIGNLVILADDDGNPVERYDYSPYGERYIWADSLAPEIEQVLLKDGEVILELSEEVQADKVESALNSTLVLRNVTQALDLQVTLTKPVSEGRNARQRLVLSVDGPAIPDPGDVLELSVSAAAFVDFFNNEMTADPTIPTFAWAATGLDVVLDTASPKLLQACLEGGKLRLEFSEILDETAAADAILVDGAETTWTLLPDGYTLESSGTFGGGAHTLSFTDDPVDLADKALATVGQIDFDGSESFIWAAAFTGEIDRLPGEFAARSAAGNPFGFKGLPVDPETGFYYFRYRYFDPDLGRFLTPDPFGYADSGNVSQFALNDPANMNDPTGEVANVAIGGAVGGVAGGLYAGYRSLVHGESFNWGYVFQGAAAGALVGSGVGLVAGATTFGATVGGSALIGAGIGGFTSSLMSGGDYEEFAVGTLKGGILGGIGGATGFGLGAAGYSGITAFGGAFAADTYAGVAVDYAFGDCDDLSDCFASNAMGSLIGGGIGTAVSRVARNLPCPVRYTCFAEGTEVATVDGVVPIEEIEVGDQVWAFNEQTGEEEPAQVVNLFTRSVDEVYLLHVGDDVIETTAEHPFKVSEEGWTEAAKLEAGDQLTRLGGETVTLDRIEVVEGAAQVFNFEVEGLHNYFVSTEQVLVHNCGQLDLFNIDSLGRWWGRRASDARMVLIGSTGGSGSSNVGRTGGQQRLRQLLADDRQPAHIRGWIQQELNQMARGTRSSIRRPPGIELAHRRGREAAKGFDHVESPSVPQNVDLHRLQHRHDDHGRLNRLRPDPWPQDQ